MRERERERERERDGHVTNIQNQHCYFINDVCRHSLRVDTRNYKQYQLYRKFIFKGLILLTMRLTLLNVLQRDAKQSSSEKNFFKNEEKKRNSI